MLKRLKKREAFRVAAEFVTVSRKVQVALRPVRPFSADRLGTAGLRMIHYIIHSDQMLRSARGRKRIACALAAARSAGCVLRRLRAVPEQRVNVSAALEVLERAVHALEAELAA